MADAGFKFADARDDAAAGGGNAFAERVLQEQSTDSLKDYRAPAAITVAVGSSIMGAVAEHANRADLAALQARNPAYWSRYAAEDLRAVRGALTNAPSWMSKAETSQIHNILERGAVRGLVAGTAGLAGTIAVDALLFPDTKRTAVSQCTDVFGLPAIAMIPMNPYAKAAAIVTAHTVGRLYDKYLA